MVQVGIEVMSQYKTLAKRSQNILRNIFSDIAIDRLGPIKLLVWKGRVISFTDTEMNYSLVHVMQVAVDTMDTIHVSLAIGMAQKLGIVIAVVMSIWPINTTHSKAPTSN
jgi:hypothetical protein